MAAETWSGEEESVEDAGGKYSRKLIHSPGGATAQLQWREAREASKNFAKDLTLEKSMAAAAASASVGIPGGDKLLGFGKHRELTYEEVLREEPEYCLNCLRRAEESGMDEEFMEFVDYIRSVSAAHATANRVVMDESVDEVDEDSQECDLALGLEEVEGGKHAGSTYAEVFDEDPQYCSWLVDEMISSPKVKRGAPLWPLVAYILHRRK